MDRIEYFSGPYEFLSNFYPSPVALDGELYPTVEHAYQAAKTLSPEERSVIRQAATPSQAKRLGRQVQLRPDWEEVKTSVMRDLLAQKFQDPALRAMLLETGAAELIEGNTWGDRTWGCTLVDGEWVGENRLGMLLMEIRGVGESLME